MMIGLIESIARSLSTSFDLSGRNWEDLPLADRERYHSVARDILRRLAEEAPCGAEALVDKIRETSKTRLGFLYMAYSLNRVEATALLAFRALSPRGEAPLADAINSSATRSARPRQTYTLGARGRTPPAS